MKTLILAGIIFFSFTWNCFSEEVNGKFISESKCEYHKHKYDCLLVEGKDGAYIVIQHNVQGEVIYDVIYKLVVKNGKITIVVLFERGIKV